MTVIKLITQTRDLLDMHLFSHRIIIITDVKTQTNTKRYISIKLKPKITR